MSRAEATSVFYQPAETGEVPKTLPWANRSEQEWKKDITKREVTRLFMLASINSPSQTSSPDQIPGFVNLWSLRTPFKVYWDSNVEVLAVDINRALDLEKRKYPDDDFDNLAPSVAMLFEDSSFYHFLMVSRQIQRQRNTYKRHERSEPEESFSQQRADALRIDSETLQALQQRYKDLVEILYPVARKYAKRISRNSKGKNTDIDDWYSIAGETLNIAALNFYWETMVIDPKWTVGVFLQTVYTYIRNPASNVFDTRTLQKGNILVERYRSRDETEKTALNNIAADELMKLISQNTRTPEEASIVYQRFLYGFSCPEIANQMGIPLRTVYSLIYKFSRRLRKLEETGPDVPRQLFFGRLFANIDHYQRLFERNKAILDPLHVRILERFFELQTGERVSSIRAVWKSLQDEGLSLTEDTVRRAINAGINRLDYRDKPPSRSSDWNRSWAEHQTARLVRAAAQTPNIWGTFSERRKNILTRCYLGEGKKPTHAEIAKELGISQATVSRNIDRALMEIRRVGRFKKGSD